MSVLGAAPGIPLYVHPAVDPMAWARAANAVAGGGFVVINVHNGPGGAGDPYYPPAVAALPPAARVGYVDIDYARRRIGALEREVRRWIRWYEVGGIMLDRVPSAGPSAQAVARIVDRVRAAGAEIVLGNPGTAAADGVAGLFDVVCDFEDSAQRYLAQEFPHPDGSVKTWHLIHGCDPSEVAACAAMARRNRVDYLYISTGVLPNPWQGQDLSLSVGESA